MRQLQITFDVSDDFNQPNDWGKFRLVCLYEQDGRQHQRVLSQDDVPAEIAPKMAVVIGALVAMDEPWRVCHAHADLISYGCHEVEQDDGSVAIEQDEAVALTVWTTDCKGGMARFDCHDYPQFILTQAEAREIFEYFTSAEGFNQK